MFALTSFNMHWSICKKSLAFTKCYTSPNSFLKLKRVHHRQSLHFVKGTDHMPGGCYLSLYPDHLYFVSSRDILVTFVMTGLSA